MPRFHAPALALALLVSSGVSHAEAPTLTPAQAAAIDKQIHDYLMSNPKVLVEALEHAEASAKADEDAANKNVLVERREELNQDPTSPVLGNPKGDITLVEFFDYQCPYCRSAAPQIQALIAGDKQLRVVMKELPILGPASVFASRVALVAAKHGKYAEFYHAMFALKGKLTDDATLEVVKSIGLDPIQVKKESEAAAIDAIIKNDLDLARAIGVNGTPAYVIADTLIPGAVDTKDMQKLIDAKRKS